jgi:hypothetical protein
VRLATGDHRQQHQPQGGFYEPLNEAAFVCQYIRNESFHHSHSSFPWFNNGGFLLNRKSMECQPAFSRLMPEIHARQAGTT